MFNLYAITTSTPNDDLITTLPRPVAAFGVDASDSPKNIVPNNSSPGLAQTIVTRPLIAFFGYFNEFMFLRLGKPLPFSWRSITTPGGICGIGCRLGPRRSGEQYSGLGLESKRRSKSYRSSGLKVRGGTGEGGTAIVHSASH